MRGPKRNERRPNCSGQKNRQPNKRIKNQRQRRRRIVPPANLAHSRAEGESVPLDILIVASKLKAYIRARSGMNTSGDVMAVLSDRVRDLCNEAIRNAAMDERKTVLGRDIPELIRRGSDSYGYD